MTMNSFPKFPKAVNEAVKEYRPNSPEKEAVLKSYRTLLKENTQVPLTINGEKIATETKGEMRPPHDHQHLLGKYSLAKEHDVEKAIDAALNVRKKWSRLPFEQRATIFLRAAELIAGPIGQKLMRPPC